MEFKATSEQIKLIGPLREHISRLFSLSPNSKEFWKLSIYASPYKKISKGLHVNLRGKFDKEKIFFTGVGKM